MIRPIILLVSIPFIAFNIGIIINSPLLTLMSIVIFLTFLLPYAGKNLQKFADNHYELSYHNFRNGFTKRCIGKRGAAL